MKYIKNKILFIEKLVGTLTILLILILVGCANEPELISTNSSSLEDEMNQPIQSTSQDFENRNLDLNSNWNTESTTIYVHISGAVNNPGVVSITNGSRLFEAIEKCGGFTENASTDYCNLALIVVDGEQYHIPTIEEAQFLVAENKNNSGLVSHYDSDGRLNINLATKEELMGLSGIGATRADAIISHRETSGLFVNVEDVKQVSGIKDALYSQIKDSICTQ